MFILYLPSFVSVIIAIIAFSSFSVALYFVVHRFWSNDISDETKRTADSVATRMGVIYGVVLGMMFTSVRIEYTDMIVAIESEASALVRLYTEIDRRKDEELNGVQKQLVEYLRFVVEEQWPALRELKHNPENSDMYGRKALDQIWIALNNIEHQPGALNLKELLDQVENFRIQRLFDTKGNMIPIFWYIAFVGYILTLLVLYLPPPTLRRCILISLYSSMVAVVLLGIFILTHPYSPAAGVRPHVFEMLLESTY